VCAVAVRKGGKHAVAGLADGTLVTLDLSGSTPKETTSQAGHSAGVACVAYSPDGNRLATVGGDGALHVWTVADNGTLTKLIHFDGQMKPGAGFTPLTGVAFAPDGRHIAAVGADTIVRVWDIQTKSEVRGLRGHVDWVTAVAFSPDGRFVASVGVEKDKALRIFELPQLDTTSAAGGHLLAVKATAVSPNGKFVATAGSDQTIKIWDIATGKEVGTLVGNADVPYTITFLGNDEVVMGCGIKNDVVGRIHFWRTSPGSEVTAVPSGQVYTVVGAADGAKVAAWVSREAVGDKIKNNTYEVFDPKGKLLSTQSDKGRNIRAVTFTADLSWAVAGDEQGTIRIWNLEKSDDRIGADWPLMENQFVDLSITADKKTVVAVDEKGLVKVADVAKRSVLAKFEAHKGGVGMLLASPTGSTFVTVGKDNEIKVWSLAEADLKEPKAIRTWAMPIGVNGVAYTPDGKRVVTANADGTAYVLELP
jgi:WD40 repeat protein